MRTPVTSDLEMHSLAVKSLKQDILNIGCLGWIGWCCHLVVLSEGCPRFYLSETCATCLHAYIYISNDLHLI